MLRTVPFSELSKLDLIPQAIISRPLSYFHKQLKIEISQGEDDLDVFEGAALWVDNRLPFALKHYPGYPDNTTTVYLSDEFTDIGEITRMIDHQGITIAQRSSFLAAVGRSRTLV